MFGSGYLKSPRRKESNPSPHPSLMSDALSSKPPSYSYDNEESDSKYSKYYKKRSRQSYKKPLDNNSSLRECSSSDLRLFWRTLFTTSQIFSCFFFIIWIYLRTVPPPPLSLAELDSMLEKLSRLKQEGFTVQFPLSEFSSRIEKFDTGLVHGNISRDSVNISAVNSLSSSSSHYYIPFLDIAALQQTPLLDNSTKYFMEGNSTKDFHTDSRFDDDETSKSVTGRNLALNLLIQNWSSFCSTHNITETWIAHGTLLGWFWNQKILTWDDDIDVQMTLGQLLAIGSLNGTLHNEGRYLLDLNPNAKYRFRQRYNVIDARFIDTVTGLFIDITVISNNGIKKDFYACKSVSTVVVVCFFAQLIHNNPPRIK